MRTTVVECLLRQVVDKFAELAALIPGGGGGGGSGDAPKVLSSITGYTGGTASDLDAYDSSVLSAGQLVFIKHATAGWRVFLFRAGTDAESSPNIIRPDAYGVSYHFVYELVV